jgi:hypothetical protein
MNARLLHFGLLLNDRPYFVLFTHNKNIVAGAIDSASERFIERSFSLNGAGCKIIKIVSTVADRIIKELVVILWHGFKRFLYGRI